MNSFNHYAYGAIGAWLYAVVAGIDFDPEAPGYRHIIMRPRPGGGLTNARAELISQYGAIRSAWMMEDGYFDWQISIPPTRPRRSLCRCRKAQKYRKSGVAAENAGNVSLLRAKVTLPSIKLAPGDYHFTAQ